MSATAELALTESQVEDLVSVMVHRAPGHGNALRTLRIQAGLTQEQLAHQFHRRKSTICHWESGSSWPPQGLLIRILERLMVSNEIIGRQCQIQLDGDLDPRLYAKGDTAEIEHLYFRKTRGEVLAALKVRARDGDTSAAKLYREWMLDNEKQIASRESKPKRVGDAATAQARSDWTKAALLAPVKPNKQRTETSAALPLNPTTPCDAVPDNGAGADKSNDVSIGNVVE